jgi:hypothetical protein
MKCLPSGLNNCSRLLMCLIETELNIVLQSVLYLNSSDLQYSICIVLLTVRLAVLKAKFVNELEAVPDLSHRIQGTNLLLACLPAMYI